METSFKCSVDTCLPHSVGNTPTSNRQQSLVMVAYEMKRSVQFSIKSEWIPTGDYHKWSLSNLYSHYIQPTPILPTRQNSDLSTILTTPPPPSRFYFCHSAIRALWRKACFHPNTLPTTLNSGEFSGVISSARSPQSAINVRRCGSRGWKCRGCVRVERLMGLLILRSSWRVTRGLGREIKGKLMKEGRKWGNWMREEWQHSGDVFIRCVAFRSASRLLRSVVLISSCLLKLKAFKKCLNHSLWKNNNWNTCRCAQTWHIFYKYERY